VLLFYYAFKPSFYESAPNTGNAGQFESLVPAIMIVGAVTFFSSFRSSDLSQSI
jgi:hypothetical protein